MNSVSRKTHFANLKGKTNGQNRQHDEEARHAGPDFKLMNVDGRQVGLHDFDDKPALLVIFMCNHCPFVKHMADGLAQLAHDYMPRGVAMVGINSNDAATHPQDSPEQMVHEAKQRGYPFPYLYDEAQEVAKAYGAACTPDFFFYDAGSQAVSIGGSSMPAVRATTFPSPGGDLARRARRLAGRQARP